MTQGRAFGNTAATSVTPAALGVVNGFDTTATGVGSNAGTLIGVNGAPASVVGDGATAYGAQSLAQDINTTAIGFRSTAKQAGSVAIGFQAQALADPSTALGANATVMANADNGVALGASSMVSGANGLAVGFNANASGANSVALGAGSVATQANTVSLGAPGSERRLTNVAAGIAPTDGANMSQLNAVAQQIGDVQRVAYSGTALALAMSSSYQRVPQAGKSVVGLGVGNYKGYTAIGLTYRKTNEQGNMTYGAGVSTTGKNTGVNVGIGWEF